MVLVLLIGLWASVLHAEQVERSYALSAQVGPAGASSLEMDLGWDWVASHDDGTMVWVLGFERAELDGVPQGLAGHQVGLRRFGDGEVLEISHAGHAMGGARALEAQDLLIGLISPHVPSLGRAGNRKTKRTVWRLRGAGGATQETVVNAQWTNLGRERTGGVPVWHLRYEGTWHTRGRAMGWAAEGEGPISGEVWLRRRDLVMVAHDFSWAREVDVDRPRGEPIHQSQAWSGRLQVQEDAPRAPRRAYMDVARVKGELVGMAGVLAACTEGTGWSVRTRVELEISQKGVAQVHGGTLDGAPGSCILAALEAHSWPEHPEADARTSFEMVVVDGRLRPLRGVEMVTRRPAWWFLLGGPGTGSGTTPQTRTP
jgi:hypothetical protein